MQINKKLGSAFLMVLGAVSVLVIITFSMLHTNTNRSFSTRFMSNEKKAEAIAESASDLMIAYIKKSMNDADATSPASDFYNIFRMPAKLVGGKLVESGDGKNSKIDVVSLPEIKDLDKNFEALKLMENMIDELGKDNISLKVNVKIANAEAFCDNNPAGYEVVGISERAKLAKGLSAKVYDSYSAGLDNDGSLSSADWAPSQWVLTYNFPNVSPSDRVQPIGSTQKVDISVNFWIFGDHDISITLTKTGPTKIKFSIPLQMSFSLPFGGDISLGTDIDGNIEAGDIIRNFLGDKIDELSMKGVREMAMPGTDGAVSSILYSALKLKNAITSEYGKAGARLGTDRVKPDNFGAADTKVVEKGGVLQIDTNVVYQPNGAEGVSIKKRLLAQIPFKVSDVQPIAPEYSFFVANSDKISEGAISGLGNKFNIESDIATMTIHNVPSASYDALTGLMGGKTDSKIQVPGMVRLNSNEMMEVNSFLGTPDEPELTELGVVTCPMITTEMRNVPIWQWADAGTVDKKHSVDFPVLFDADLLLNPVDPVGLSGIVDFFSTGAIDLAKTPALFYGLCHLEYPLGIRLEAPLDMYYGHIEIKVDPKAELLADDVSEVYVDYKRIKMPYGLVGYPAYDSATEWSTNKWANMPANCYSLLQYAKKASYFYADGNDFLNDSDRKDGDTINIDGVTYIKGSLNISSSTKFKGKGIIVVKGNIHLSGDVIRADDDTVISLVARGVGGILFKNGCSIVQAACFSNNTPVVSSSGPVKIYGNLVCNKYDQSKIGQLEVFYDSNACRTSPLSVMRDVGKFDPSRYHVSMSENWSKFEYAKQ